MTTDLDIVEQRFATLTAEITSNVLKITKESAGIPYFLLI